MQLTYRGVKYDYNPPTVELKTTEEVGKFRGVDIRFRTVKKAPVHQPTLDLVYRGAAYQIGQSTTEAATVAAPAVATAPTTVKVAAEDRARIMMMNRHRSVKRRQQSMLGRLATEVGLPADAVNYWNHIQGKVHPSFWATYSRGGAAAS